MKVYAVVHSLLLYLVFAFSIREVFHYDKIALILSMFLAKKLARIYSIIAFDSNGLC